MTALAGSEQGWLSEPPAWLYSLLQFFPWSEKAEFAILSPRYSQRFGDRAGVEFWSWGCQALAIERNLYVPAQSRVGWRVTFFDLWRYGQPQEFNIQVFARFRPAGMPEAGQQKATSLPLHQRVRALRAQQPTLTRSEALRRVMLSQGHRKDDLGMWNDPWARSVGDDDADDKENTAPDARKLQAKTDNGAQPSIIAIEDTQVVGIVPGTGLRAFSAAQIWAPGAQEDIYARAAAPLVMDFLNGISSCMLLYGQTGSGKTYTAFGDRSDLGIVLRACDEVIRGLPAGAELYFSFVELFGNEVTDLLTQGVVGQEGANLLGVRRHADTRVTDRIGHRYVLDGRTNVRIECMAELEQYLRVGDSHKRRAATAMNERSTRAHTVVVLTRQCEGVMNRLFFADLGGSEQLNKSRAADETKAPVVVVGGEEQSRITWQEYYQHRKRVEETQQINKGLFALKQCVDALHRREIAKREGMPLPYIPYQDSKLTMLLQEGLGGRAKTTVVCCCSRDDVHAVETFQTLRFGERCAALTSSPEVTEKELMRAIAALDAQIAELEQAIEKKERWEERRVKRVDERHGADVEIVKAELISQGRLQEAENVTGDALTGEEEVVTSVLVGAELERATLEKVLRTRRELLGEEWTDDSAWKAENKAWHTDQKQVLLPHERKLERRFSKAAVATDRALQADALEFIFRKTATAVREQFGEETYARLTQGITGVPHEYLQALAQKDLSEREESLQAMLQGLQLTALD
jgi:kinesin family protein 5